MNTTGTLIFFCGKMGAGKSTLSKRIAENSGVVRISEDEWLSALYPSEINTIRDYIHYAPRLKQILSPHVCSMLRSGITVALDFPANTIDQRRWFKSIIDTDSFPYKLVYLDIKNARCLEQIEKRRREDPSRTRFDTEQVFHEITKYFVAPTAEEGFDIEIITDLNEFNFSNL